MINRTSIATSCLSPATKPSPSIPNNSRLTAFRCFHHQAHHQQVRKVSLLAPPTTPISSLLMSPAFASQLCPLHPSPPLALYSASPGWFAKRDSCRSFKRAQVAIPDHATAHGTFSRGRARPRLVIESREPSWASVLFN